MNTIMCARQSYTIQTSYRNPEMMSSRLIPCFPHTAVCFNCTILPSTYKTHRKFPEHSIAELETLTRTTLTLILQKPISIHRGPNLDHTITDNLHCCEPRMLRAQFLCIGKVVPFVAVEAAAKQARNAESRGILIARFRHASARSFTRTYCGLNAFQVRPETKFLEIKLPRVVTTLNEVNEINFKVWESKSPVGLQSTSRWCPRG